MFLNFFQEVSFFNMFAIFMHMLDEIVSKFRKYFSDDGKHYGDLQNLLPNVAQIPWNSETELNYSLLLVLNSFLQFTL